MAVCVSFYSCFPSVEPGRMRVEIEGELKTYFISFVFLLLILWKFEKFEESIRAGWILDLFSRFSCFLREILFTMFIRDAIRTGLK